ncbi:hypothetical protein BH11MYX2_BH11MYX2_10060 [soil metagenome]
MQGEHVVGVLSQRDLGGTRQELPPAGCVSDFMSSNVVVASPDMTLAEAAGLMRAHKIDCLPVVDGKRLVGIVTTWDVLAVVEHPPRPVAHRTKQSSQRQSLKR